MTLLICLATRKSIHISADHRLTLDDGTIVSDTSSKIVELHYHDWQAVVTYTGVGRTGKYYPKDTAELLAEWLEGMENAQLDGIANRIVEKGNSWLSRFPKPQRHTFLIMGVQNRKPIAYIISNFEDVASRSDPQPAKELSISTKRGGSLPWLIVAGQKPAVDRNLRKRILSSIPPGSDDPQRARSALRSANEEASRSRLSAGTVSSSCTTLTMRADGSGSTTPDGPVDSYMIMNGNNLPFKNILSSLGMAGAPVIGATFAVPGKKLPFGPCPKQVVRPNSSLSFSIEEIEISGGEVTISSINSRGEIVGCSSPREDQQLRFVFIEKGGELTGTNVQGVPTCINDLSAISLNVPTDGNKELPALLVNGRVQMLDVGDATYANVTHLNRTGDAVGWVCLDLQETGQRHHRPAAWLGEQLSILKDVPCDWGYAARINTSGMALVIGYRGNTNVTFLWNTRTAELTEVASSGPVALHLTEDASILGSFRSAGGHTTVIAHPGSDWRTIPTSAAFYGRTMNEKGDIAGRITEAKVGFPAILTAQGEVAKLPYYRDHFGEVAQLNDAMIAIGVASTDHGKHALVWRPE